MTVLIAAALALAAPSIGEFAVYLPAHPTAFERLAAREVRRYVYLRTGKLAPMIPADTLPKGAQGVVVGNGDGALARSTRVTVGSRNPEAFRLKTMDGGSVVVVSGASNRGTLFGAYAFAEKLGVRFYLHGDVVPDERIPLRLPTLDVARRPLFELRGILPFHDFPEGPDWWSADDYKAVLNQLPKLGMGFIGLHTYPEGMAEPTVWIGLPEDVGPAGKVPFAYPAGYHNTMRGLIGYSAKPTSLFGAGAALLFDRDDYGNEVMRGLTPLPDTDEEYREVFGRAGAALAAAFEEAGKLGIVTCLGTETPLTIPARVKERLRTKGIDPDTPEAKRLVYEGMFERIKRTHRLDYYWFWTPEGWTWGGNTQADLDRTVSDLDAARQAAQKVKAPFRLATCGWVLGPQNDRALFDRLLPKDMAVSCISRAVGMEPVDPGFANVVGRDKWAIPWLEDDPAMTAPQLWVGRMRRDAQDALRYGCNGLMGIHWRTRILGPNVAALSRAMWDQSGLPAVAAGPVEALGGNVAEYKVPIAGTDQPAIYQTVRWNVPGYSVKVRPGKCDVKLLFSELAYERKGARVFDVSINGKEVLKNLDVWEKVGKNRAFDATFEGIDSPDGVVRIGFAPVVEYPCIAGIVVTWAGGSLKIDCGGPGGKGWISDVPPERPIPVEDFYLDWACSEFGPKAAKEAARLLSRIDGKLPRPLDWVEGPGGLLPDGRAWSEVEPDYAFVDEFAAVQGKVRGDGALERFGWWRTQFEYLRTVAKLRCEWASLDRASAAGDRTAATAQIEVVRKLLATVRRQVLSTVSTRGEMGTVANWEEHIVPSLEASLKRAEALTGVSPAAPDLEYDGPLRIVVPTVRARVDPGHLKLEVIVLGKAAPTVYWRPMGRGAFRSVVAKHVARGVYSVEVPAREDLEYYVKAAGAVWPATAPTINQTVVVARLDD